MNYDAYFNAYPKTDRFYFTTDRLAFAEKETAEAHQNTLKKGRVEVVERKKVTGKNTSTNETKTK